MIHGDVGLCILVELYKLKIPSYWCEYQKFFAWLEFRIILVQLVVKHLKTLSGISYFVISSHH